MGRYLLTPQAKTDLREIFRYIRRESKSDNVLKKVRATFVRALRKLADEPGMGHCRKDICDEPVRFWAMYSYLVVYREHTKPLQVLRVVHGARRLRGFVEGDES
jgi:plasmid stabilization system protein ParE